MHRAGSGRAHFGAVTLMYSDIYWVPYYLIVFLAVSAVLAPSKRASGLAQYQNRACSTFQIYSHLDIYLSTYQRGHPSAGGTCH